MNLCVHDEQAPSLAMAGLGNAGLLGMGMPATTQWETHLSDSGRPYYFNVLTNQSTWEAPPEVLMNLMMSMGAAGMGTGLTQATVGSGPRGPHAGLVNGQHPIRPGEPDCSFYLKSGSCKFGEGCKFNHPPEKVTQMLATATVGPPAGLVNGLYPIRPGQPDCSFFMNSGACKYGETCKFNHPPEKAGSAPTGLVNGKHPIRPGVADCSFFVKQGDCKFGEGCKFNHPPEKASAAMAAGVGVSIQPLQVRTQVHFFHHVHVLVLVPVAAYAVHVLLVLLSALFY